MIDPDMGKKDRKSPKETAESFGVGKLTRHIFICLGPDCVDKDDGEKTWDYVKKRMKELNVAGADGPCFRTRCACLRICTAGPIAVVYPEGVWYTYVDNDDIDEIVESHLKNGKVVERLLTPPNVGR